MKITKALKVPFMIAAGAARGAWAALKGFTFYPLASGRSMFSTFPGSKLNWGRDAGDLWRNSIVSAAIGWAMRVFPEAPIVVEKRAERDAKLVWEVQPDHPLEELMERPNAFYDGSVLLGGVLLSLMVDGNAYILKERKVSGGIGSLWYVPHFQVSPVSRTGSALIEEYRFNHDGRSYTLPPDDVIHLRLGVDPDDIRKGLSPLAAALREVATDNECANYSALLLKNRGIPGVVLSPRTNKDETGTVAQMTEDDVTAIAARFKEKFTGDRRGEAMVLTGAFEVSTVGFNPAEMSLDMLRRIPETRIAACVGIPAIVLGLMAGLERSTFANFKEAREAAYEEFVIPLQRTIAKQLTLQLLGEFAADTTGYRVGFDLSEVRVLQEDRNAIVDRCTRAVQGGFMKVSEARRQIGLRAGAEDDVYLWSSAIMPVTSADGWLDQADPAPGAKGDDSGTGTPGEQTTKGATNGHDKEQPLSRV